MLIFRRVGLQDDVDAAAQMIEDLLQPQDETRNEHKRLQLRELAQLNGTLKDEEARLPLSKFNSLWPPVIRCTVWSDY